MYQAPTMLSSSTKNKTSSVNNSNKRGYIFQKNKISSKEDRRIIIEQVTSVHEFKVFMDLPKSIYQDDEGWIQPLWTDEKNFFKRKNHFWSHADCVLFIALKDSIPVGRIVGVIDKLFIKESGEKAGFFGFYETINDKEVSQRLLTAVESWLRKHHCTKIIGPVNGRVDNGAGFLINTYGAHPTIFDSYSPKYYTDLMVNFDMKKHRDLLNFSVDLTKPLSNELRDIAQKTATKYHLHLRKFNRWKSRSELNWWIPFFLKTFSSHWGYIPVENDEVRKRYGLRNIRWVIDADLFIIAEDSTGPVGYLWGTPDYNQVFKKIDGPIDLFSALKNIGTLRSIDYGKLNVIGIKKEYQNKQLALLLNYEILVRMQKRGYKSADIGWIDEKNTAALKVIEKMDATPHKKFRVFEKDITMTR